MPPFLAHFSDNSFLLFENSSANAKRKRGASPTLPCIVRLERPLHAVVLLGPVLTINVFFERQLYKRENPFKSGRFPRLRCEAIQKLTPCRLVQRKIDDPGIGTGGTSVLRQMR
jgi:hypothetical protein